MQQNDDHYGPINENSTPFSLGILILFLLMSLICLSLHLFGILANVTRTEGRIGRCRQKLSNGYRIAAIGVGTAECLA